MSGMQKRAGDGQSCVPRVMARNKEPHPLGDGESGADKVTAVGDYFFSSG